MLSLTITVILLLLALLILAGPLLEELLDRLIPPGGRRPASPPHSPTRR